MHRRALAASIVILTATATHLAAFSGHMLIFSPWSSPGLAVVNIESGARVVLHPSGTNTPAFSPDGRKVAFRSGNELCFVNNDGTGLVRSGYSWTVSGLGYSYITWNTDAIYHNDGGGKIYRYDLGTRTARVIYSDSGVGNQAGQPVVGYDQGAWVCASGARALMWTYRASDPFYGANVLLEFGADWNTYTRRYTRIWGHSWLMSRDGQHAVIMSLAGGRAHKAWDIFDFAKDSLLYFTAMPDVPNPGEMNTGEAGYVANANDYITFSSATDTSNIHAFMQNWKTGAFTEVPRNWVDFVSNKYLIRIGGGWLGALPSPTATTPEIALNRTDLAFTASATQNVTVTNNGAGTLTRVSAAVSPAAPWLTVTVQGTGGNTQTIANTTSVTGLADGSYSTTVTVSGGGATNSAQYTAQLTVGTGIASPTGLTAIVGGATARDVSLAWTDNATNETGYSVERRKLGGAWGVIATLAANAAAYADNGRDTGTWNYRVRAVRSTSYSNYSNTVDALVIGLPSVTLTSPTAAQVVTDSVLHIRWSAYQVTNVQVKYSLDGGEDWINLNQTGGVTDQNSLWGDFPWRLPDINNDNVIVWVHDYMASGFGAQSGVFSIRRASSVSPAVAVAGGFDGPRVFVSGGNTLAMRAPHAATFDIFSLDGTLAARVNTESGRGAQWQAPQRATWVVTVRESDSDTRGSIWKVTTTGTIR